MDPLDEKVTGNEFSQSEKKKGSRGAKKDLKNTFVRKNILKRPTAHEIVEI